MRSENQLELTEFDNSETSLEALRRAERLRVDRRKILAASKIGILFSLP